jgi:hypothetical protein
MSRQQPRTSIDVRANEIPVLDVVVFVIIVGG